MSGRPKIRTEHPDVYEARLALEALAVAVETGYRGEIDHASAICRGAGCSEEDITTTVANAKADMIGCSNAGAALDPTGDYATFDEALAAYAVNVVDTAREQCVSADRAMVAFWNAWRAHEAEAREAYRAAGLVAS